MSKFDAFRAALREAAGSSSKDAALKSALNEAKLAEQRVATAFKSLEERLFKIMTPLERAKATAALNKEFRKLIKAGKAELITSAHPDEKLSAIGKIFEELNDHPLARRFLRKEPRLILVEDDFVKQTGLPGNFSAAGGKTTIISESSARKMPLEEIRIALAHEQGHHMALDHHLRNITNPMDIKASHEREYLADKLAVVLTHDGEAAKKTLTNIYSVMKEKATQDGTIVEYVMLEDGNSAHPALEKRLRALTETESQIATPEGRSFVEAELARELNRKHSALFPHRPER